VVEVFGLEIGRMVVMEKEKEERSNDYHRKRLQRTELALDTTRSKEREAEVENEHLRVEACKKQGVQGKGNRSCERIHRIFAGVDSFW
jgi:hypothetical protein